MKILQKFFSRPVKPSSCKELDPLDRFFRVDQAKKPRIAIGVQKPTYELPITDNYQKWAQDRISEKLKSYSLKPIQDEKICHSNGPDAIPLYMHNGVRDYSQLPNRQLPTAGAGQGNGALPGDLPGRRIAGDR